MTIAPLRRISMSKPSIGMETLADGSVLLTNGDPLQAYENQWGDMLRRWAGERPDKTYLAERDAAGGWRKVTYAEARKICDSMSQALLDRGLGPERPVMLLSGNSIDHGLLSLAAMQVGIPVAPVSPAYSLMSQDFVKVKLINDLVKPGLVYAASGGMFESVLNAVDFGGAEILYSADAPAGRDATQIDELRRTTATGAVDTAFAAVDPDSAAKYLFTSGSTGMPKGVINTHRMLCANQQMNVQQIPFYAEVPPVLVDWLPWNHTFGGNFCQGLVLKTGGTFYVDEGKPAPGLIEKTVANLREISPTAHYNVPVGYGMLMPYLEQDQELRETFFKDLGFIFYAAAALSQDLWQRLEKLALDTVGERIVMASAFGSTESAPMITATHWIIDHAGNVGVPAPGIEVKLAPVAEKMEIRGKGPTITPGYLGRPDLTEAAFDEDGFFKFGDGMRLEDPDDPTKGLLFDGRVTEDFKLDTGTWVHPGVLRPDLIAAAAPAIQDAVVCGHDKPFIGLLVWPNPVGCREIGGLVGDVSADDIAANSAVRDFIAGKLAAHNQEAGGSSRSVKRVLLMTEPPQIDANEITDKGYVNQRATLDRRADLVAKLYEAQPGDDVIQVG